VLFILRSILLLLTSRRLHYGSWDRQTITALKIAVVYDDSDNNESYTLSDKGGHVGGALLSWELGCVGQFQEGTMDRVYSGTMCPTSARYAGVLMMSFGSVVKAWVLLGETWWRCRRGAREGLVQNWLTVEDDFLVK